MLKELFKNISIWIIVLPLVAGLINYKGLNKDSKWIFFLVCFALVPQILTFFINTENHTLNLSYNIYTLLEFAILFFLFLDKYQHKYNKFILKLTLFIYFIITCVFLINKGLENKFLNELVCVNNIIYMIWFLLFLKEQYSVTDSSVRAGNPFAWYLLGLLIYCPCSVMDFALYYYIREANLKLLNLWIIQSICNILLYIFFAIGLFIPKQKRAF